MGYFLRPSELFNTLAEKGNNGGDNYILDELQAVMNHIEQTTMGTESEDDFNALFEDIDLSSTKIGKTPKARNEIIVSILNYLNKIDFKLEEAEADVLGDAYEYLIKELNYLDAVIGLPTNIFYGTSIPTCIMVFKKWLMIISCLLMPVEKDTTKRWATKMH